MLQATTISAEATAKAGRGGAATGQRCNGRSEALLASIILCAFSFPILAFQPSLDMNGMNRAASQLSRKVVSDQQHALAPQIVEQLPLGLSPLVEGEADGVSHRGNDGLR